VLSPPVVLGAGDTAFDCATSSFRCGASRVIVAFRRGIPDMRAVPEESELAKEERCEFLPYMQPKQVVVKNGRIVALELFKMEKGDDGEYHIDEDQFIRLKCDFVISAFGSCIDSDLRHTLAPLTFDKWGVAQIDTQTMQAIDVCIPPITLGLCLSFCDPFASSELAEWLTVGSDTVAVLRRRYGRQWHNC